MKVFDTWKEAHTAAVKLAKQTKSNVALRKKKEFNKTVYVVSLACLNDAQNFEIVKPDDTL